MKSVPKSQLFLWGLIVVLLLASIAISITSIAVDVGDLGVRFYGKMLGPLAAEVLLLVLYVHASVRYMQLRRASHRYPNANDNSDNNLRTLPGNLHHYHSLFLVGLTLLFAFVLLGVSTTRLFRYGLSPSDQCQFIYYDTDYVLYDPKVKNRQGLPCSMWVAQLYMGAVTSFVIVIDTFFHGCRPVPRNYGPSASYEMAPPASASSQYYVTPVYPGQHPETLPPYANPPPHYQPPAPGAVYWQPPAHPPPPAAAAGSYPPPATPPPAVASASTAGGTPSSPPPPAAQETIDTKRS
ncbi:hypothetical protein BGZ73_006071 [Actinomortierella ambigua]|nr:hypothetical protein BGZ73_006071 [Actinomortierella ambigua]